ncbi:hypothetical protein V4Q74_00550 [Mycoplasmoides genitalium]|uniref:Uncharacterized lipoprotein MG095 n=2 Tax=Mycoplasmoides genitalium TaxID=2097 RepID=Y095_MYCGE|nr:hypothetical protein [Mycoplasmoides genitalium]P47341.1 RecName: Full=Uncharacterized lipoprotein MG095; Flags: Precursor [Mycoplasmoides genitalium G37]ABY79394.1 lipoprotein, putative [synthetic Mycoplasma genitalium JCVI-1.0]AAC71313.1 lipoprotein, putative [Mycoplasmoides genitalium G37]AFQ03901.1 lipoprotein [Mycoplasmoides genitalium M6320]AFQ04401.1 lipoprotein [Mycoplasmoides genitalium M2288]
MKLKFYKLPLITTAFSFVFLTACSTPQSSFFLPAQTTISTLKINGMENKTGYFLETQRSRGSYNPTASLTMIKLGDEKEFKNVDTTKQDEVLFANIYGGISSLLNFRIIQPMLTYWNLVNNSLSQIGSTNDLITFKDSGYKDQLAKALANNLIVADEGNNNFWFGLKALKFDTVKLQANNTATSSTRASTTQNTNNKIDAREKITINGNGGTNNDQNATVQKLIGIENIEVEFSFVKTGFNGNEIKFEDYVTDSSPTTSLLKQVWKSKWNTELTHTSFKFKLNSFNVLLTYQLEANQKSQYLPNGFSFLFPSNLEGKIDSSKSYWNNLVDFSKRTTNEENTMLLTDLQKKQDQVNRFVGFIGQNHFTLSANSINEKQFNDASTADFFKAIFQKVSINE